MTLDSLLVVLGLLAAVYAVLACRRRLELAFAWGRSHWVVSVAVVFLVHFLVLHSTWEALEWREKWSRAVPPGVVAYGLLAGALVMVAIPLSRARLTARRVQKLRRLLEGLLAEREYGEILNMLATHLDRLADVAGSRLAVQKTRRTLEEWSRAYPDPIQRALDSLAIKHHGGQPPSEFALRARSWLRPLWWLILALLPDYSQEAEDARLLLRDFLLSPDVLDEMCRNRPYEGLEVLELDFDFAEEFEREFFARLLADSSSALYFEIKHNQNFAQGRRHAYSVPQSNRLLHFLFSDPRRAEKLEVWKPVGDWVIRKLDELSFVPDEDTYNYPVCDFFGHGKWYCPIFIAIRFFDIMVSAAMYHGIEYHMWLFYFPEFARRIARNWKPHTIGGIDYSEWDTRYEYLLRELTNALGHWVLAAEDFDEKHPHAKPDSVSLNPEADNIPKSALFALGSCLRPVLLNDGVSESVKRSLMHGVFHDYFQLRSSERLSDYAHVLRSVLRTGGGLSSSRHVEFCKEAALHLRTFDKIPWKSEHVLELRRALTQ